MKCKDWFIDADTHITEPGDVWTSRLPQKFRDAAPRMVRLDDGMDRLAPFLVGDPDDGCVEHLRVRVQVRVPAA